MVKNQSPKLSIIIPSYNQGQYIEETILSILNQNYLNLEIIIIDGGSTDNTIEIIKKYESKISYWVSEKDEGQSDAINKGFKKATGDWMAWMNSDDCYLPHAFKYIFCQKSVNKYDFIYGPTNIGKEINSSKILNSKQTKLSPLNLLKFFYSVDYIIPSQSVFIKKEFLSNNKIEFLNQHLHYCMDMEWYLRIAFAKPKIYKYDQSISFFRINDTTKTGSSFNKMQTESIQIMYHYLNRLSSKHQNDLKKTLFLHRILHKIWIGKLNNSFLLLFRTIKHSPNQAILDRRFLGLLKKQIF